LNLILSNKSKDSCSKSSPHLISETLLEELYGCIKEIEIVQREKEAQQKKESGRPDYSWLMNESVRQYKISPLLKLELEELCSQIDLDGAPSVIRDFRRVVSQETPLEKIPECFKAVIKRQLIIQNLKAEPRDERKPNKNSRNPEGFFTRRLEVPHLREKNLEAWGAVSSHVTEARVNSAPASSWRFLRQSRVQPTNSFDNEVEVVKSSKNEETRRANSVPTITTVV